jgi:hypothetical protein
MTDQQPALIPLNPQRQALANRLSARVKQAVELMVWSGKAYDAAATESGLTVRAMRLALARPHVMAYYRNEMNLLRSSEGPKSIIRLAQIRDAADNMPAVNAAKHLLEPDEHQPNNKQTTSPGVQIRIVSNALVNAAPDYPQQINCLVLKRLPCVYP